MRMTDAEMEALAGVPPSRHHPGAVGHYQFDFMNVFVTKNTLYINLILDLDLINDYFF